ncbi:hypothetical protein HY440_02135 [Candidatus Microgenomates bacterium]|nr:hypothetical protein [Candidatus Microgenomates bacterium]
MARTRVKFTNGKVVPLEMDEAPIFVEANDGSKWLVLRRGDDLIVQNGYPYNDEMLVTTFRNSGTYVAGRELKLRNVAYIARRSENERRV